MNVQDLKNIAQGKFTDVGIKPSSKDEAKFYQLEAKCMLEIKQTSEFLSKMPTDRPMTNADLYVQKKINREKKTD